jgi:YidC/Oxa1 family membrane protein insertase
MDNIRLLLFFALAMILMLLFQAWQKEYAPPPVAATPTHAPAAGDDAPVAPNTPSAGSDAAVAAPESEPEAPDAGTRVEVETDLMRAEIGTRGGDLRNLWLLKHPVSVDQPDKPFPLLQDSDAKELFIAQSGLVPATGVKRDVPTHDVMYSAASKRYTLAAGQAELRVPLTWRGPDGVRYTKIYVFHRGSYLVDIEFQVQNPTKQEWSGHAYARFVRAHVNERSWFALPTYVGGAIYTPEKKYEKISLEDMNDQRLDRESTNGWVAMLQHYFVGAWIANPDEHHRFRTPKLANGQRAALEMIEAEATRVAPGQTGRLQLKAYLGPKEQSQLEQIAPGLELTVDYGALTFISKPLFLVLKWIHRQVGNWGWSIILLTILIKAAFYWLSAASYRSMAKMKKVAPAMQAINERYANDKQKKSQALMELYQKEKINPLGGCLPILVQIPVFIALYWVLLESVEMRHAPWILWINDLSSKDPYYVLPIIMGASMYAQQLLNPQPPDPVQRKLFMIMPLAFTVFFLFFPAGLVLYWVVNNMLSILQQWYITRQITAKSA